MFVVGLSATANSMLSEDIKFPGHFSLQSFDIFMVIRFTNLSDSLVTCDKPEFEATHAMNLTP